MIKKYICCLSCSKSNLKFFIKPNTSKIIKFKNKSNRLSDEDIKYLFVGLVNLIKSNIHNQLDDMYRLQIVKYKNIIDASNLKINRLKNQIKKLEEKNCNDM